MSVGRQSPNTVTRKVEWSDLCCRIGRDLGLHAKHHVLGSCMHHRILIKSFSSNNWVQVFCKHVDHCTFIFFYILPNFAIYHVIPCLLTLFLHNPQLNAAHTCVREQRGLPLIHSGFLAKHYLNEFRSNPTWPIHSMRERVITDLQIDFKPHVLRRAKRMVLQQMMRGKNHKIV